MPYNAIAESFATTQMYTANPVVTEPAAYNGLTGAQLLSIGFTAFSVSTTSSVAEAAKVRKTMTLAVGTDANIGVWVGNQNTIAGTLYAPVLTPLGVTFAPQGSGFHIVRGQSIQLAPFNDALYAVCSTGTSTLYYLDT